MRERFWHERWQNNEIAFHQPAASPHLERFWPQLNMSTGAEVFVPLCGKSLDMLWLREQGLQVLGIELSDVAVRDFFAENNLEPTRSKQGKFERWQVDGITLLLGDFFELAVDDLQGVSAVYDRASLIALPPDMRFRYAEHLAGILPDAAETLLVTLEYPQQEMDGPPFSVSRQAVNDLFGGWRDVACLHSESILENLPRFQEKGLTSLTETVYRLSHFADE